MPNPITVGFVLYPNCTLLDFAGATQIFAYADNFKPVWIAADLAPIPTTEGVSVMPNATFGDIREVDVLFVPGGGSEGVGGAMQDAALQAWLKTAADNAQWVGSVCTGAFVLATAGLFDGCKVTTYWSARPQLAMFTALQVVPGYPRWHLDVEKKRFSGGGISSSIDLALKLVETIAGIEVAQAAQLRTQYAPAPPVQSGDPSEASPELVIATVQGQADFTAGLTAAVEAVQAGHCGR